MKNIKQQTDPELAIPKSDEIIISKILLLLSGKRRDNIYKIINEVRDIIDQTSVYLKPKDH